MAEVQLVVFHERIEAEPADIEVGDAPKFEIVHIGCG